MAIGITIFSLSKKITIKAGDITRFQTGKYFFSYCRLTPSARNFGGKVKQKSSSKDGNKYLKIVFSDAVVHAIQYYSVIKRYHNSKLGRKKKQITKAIISDEIARIVYYVLKNKTYFNNKFKGIALE